MHIIHLLSSVCPSTCLFEQESKVQTTLLRGNIELREMIAFDERQKLERENQTILQEKLDSLKLELEQEKAELMVSTDHEPCMSTCFQSRK